MGGHHSWLPLNSSGLDALTTRANVLPSQSPILILETSSKFKKLPFLKTPLNTFPGSFPVTTLAEVARLTDFLLTPVNWKLNLTKKVPGCPCTDLLLLGMECPSPFLCQLILN